jgi:hypothetical protein
MATSQARIVANQLNARKSTGPRTVEGKARSRRNAIKHGMTGQSVAMHDENQAELDAEMEQWVEELAKEGQVARRFAEKAFRAFVRSSRCERAEDAELADLTKQADLNFLSRHHERICELAEKIHIAPGSAVIELRTTPDGCRWLQAHWKNLAKRMRTGSWDEADTALFLKLSARNFEPDFTFEPSVEILLKYFRAAEPIRLLGIPLDASRERILEDLSEHQVLTYLSIKDHGKEALKLLQGYIRRQIDELESLSQIVEEDFQLRRQLARQQALAGDTPSMARIRRYMAAADGQMHRNTLAAVRESKRQLAELAIEDVAEAESLAESVKQDLNPAKIDPETPEIGLAAPEIPPTGAPNEPNTPEPEPPSHPHPTDATEPQTELNTTDDHISIYRQ